MQGEVIVAAVDFSGVTQAVYEAAAALATGGAQVVVLNVQEPEVDYVGMAPPQAYASAEESVARAAEAALRVAREFFEQRSIGVETVHRTGAVVGTILAEAAARRAKWVVLGSHGHGALYNLLVGSIAGGVIRGAEVPVVLVPDRGASPGEGNGGVEGGGA